MAYETIILEKRDGIAKVTLNRPEKLNALSPELLAELGDALDDVDADHDTNVLVITGAGRAFSSGFDISPRDRAEVPSTAKWETTHLPPKTLMKLWRLRQPTVAAVNGHAIAAGNMLAMCADIVIASDEATFGEPEIRHVAHSPAMMMPYLVPFRKMN